MNATYNLEAVINTPLTTLSGRGDGDVNTKSGRRTRVTAHWSLALRTEGTASVFDVYFSCEIQEMQPDYTTISNAGRTHVAGFWVDPAMELLDVPTGSYNFPNVEGDNGNQYGFTRIVSGRQRGFVNWTSEPLVRAAGFTRFFVAIDGDGRDDRGNCAVNATLRIPITTRPKMSGTSSSRMLSGSKALRVKVADHIVAARKDLGLKGRGVSVRKIK